MQLRSVATVLGLLALHGCGSPQAPRSELKTTPDITQKQPATAVRGSASQISAAKKPPARPWSYNVALAIHGATAIGGERPQLLIDGNSNQFDGGEGYAHTDWTAKPQQSMLITLRETESLNTIRFRLWDQDNRFYRYKVEVSASADGDTWKTVADHSTSGEYRSWQLIAFPAETVRRIRITGTHDSANNQFHVVECQAYNIPADVNPVWEEKKVEMPSAATATGSSANEW
jgi:hypothetical protein